jgi:uncharacterized protein YqgV (UPF0045/DUF77 family)
LGRPNRVDFSYKFKGYPSHHYRFVMPTRLAVLGFTVEPFVEGHPGPFVTAAIDAANEAGLAVEMGPFSNVGQGSVGQIAAALEKIVLDAFAAGASRISFQVST